MSHSLILRCLPIFVAVLTAGRLATARERIDLPTRPRVTQPAYITAAPAPRANLILLPGGSGVVAQLRNNFLMRVAHTSRSSLRC
jgi:hypothetical protein